MLGEKKLEEYMIEDKGFKSNQRKKENKKFHQKYETKTETLTKR